MLLQLRGRHVPDPEMMATFHLPEFPAEPVLDEEVEWSFIAGISLLIADGRCCEALARDVFIFLILIFIPCIHYIPTGFSSLHYAQPPLFLATSRSTSPLLRFKETKNRPSKDSN